MDLIKIIIILVVLIVVIVGIILAVVLPKAISAKTSTEYDIQKTRRMKNYSYLNTNYAESGQTVLIGDSITEMYCTVDLFDKYIKSTGISVYNRGIGGDTSDKMLERTEINVVNINPRNLIILIGTNDIGRIETFNTVKNIEETIRIVQSKCPDTNIVLQAIYPVNSTMSVEAKMMVGGRTNKRIKEINSRIAKVAKDKGIVFLDLTKELADSKGNLNALYSYDGLHLTVPGYEVVTKQLIPLLK